MSLRKPTRTEMSLAGGAVLLFLLLMEALLVKKGGALFLFAYAWFGFSITVVLIAGAHHLQKLIKRPKEYYPAEDKNG